MKPVPRTEKSIMLEIMSALSYKDWRCFRMPPSIYSGQKGVPDLYCIRHGISVWIEVKSQKGKLSKQQEEWGRRIDEAGGIYIVARSAEFVIRCLESIVIVMCDNQGQPGQSIRPGKGMRLMVGGRGNGQRD